VVHNAFLSIMAFFVFSCGSVLVFSAWPRQFFRPTFVEVLALTLGGLMDIASGYAIAMVVS